MNTKLLSTVFIFAYFLNLSCGATGGSGVEKTKIARNLEPRSNVIIRVRLLSPGEGSKYKWAKLEVLEVLKNNTKIDIGKVIEVAYLSEIDPGIPNKDFTAYLEAYNSEDATNTRLKFLDGSVRVGTNQPLINSSGVQNNRH